MFPLRLALKIIFQNFFLIPEKWIYLQNYSKKFWFSFALSLARLFGFFEDFSESIKQLNFLAFASAALLM